MRKTPDYRVVNYRFVPDPVKFSHPELLMTLGAVIVVQAVLLCMYHRGLWWLWAPIGLAGALLPTIMLIMEARTDDA